MGDPSERPKVYIEALQEWFENPRDTLKVHFEQLGRAINRLIDTWRALRYTQTPQEDGERTHYKTSVRGIIGD